MRFSVYFFTAYQTNRSIRPSHISESILGADLWSTPRTCVPIFSLQLKIYEILFTTPKSCYCNGADIFSIHVCDCETFFQTKVNRSAFHGFHSLNPVAYLSKLIKPDYQPCTKNDCGVEWECIKMMREVWKAGNHPFIRRRGVHQEDGRCNAQPDARSRPMQILPIYSDNSLPVKRPFSSNQVYL